MHVLYYSKTKDILRTLRDFPSERETFNIILTQIYDFRDFIRSRFFLELVSQSRTPDKEDEFPFLTNTSFTE